MRLERSDDNRIRADRLRIKAQLDVMMLTDKLSASKLSSNKIASADARARVPVGGREVVSPPSAPRQRCVLEWCYRRAVLLGHDMNSPQGDAHDEYPPSTTVPACACNFVWPRGLNCAGSTVDGC